MGSLCNSNNQTTSTYTPSAQGSQLYGQVINSAEQAASTPYQAYSGELVAPVNAEQNTGISNINAASGIASPYINTAANYAQQGAAPITAAQISSYENPYQSDVINSTLANINETNTQQQQQLKGNAISSGAFGGDRAGIASAELSRQQDLASNQTISGLNAQNYNQALTAAQADRSAAGQAAYTYGNLGTTAQNAALTGAGAQLQAGGVQQTTQQASDTAGYNQYLQALAYPYQQAQFLAGVGIPAASGLGGTQTTTPPQPNAFSQYAGLALAGASFLKRGGRVSHSPTIDLTRGRDGAYHYAAGGNTPFSSAPFSIANAGGVGWIPSVQIQSPQMPKFPGATAPTNNAANLAQSLKSFSGSSGYKDLKGMFNSSGSPTDLGSGYTPSSMGDLNLGDADGTGLSGFGGFYSHGGLVDAVRHMRGVLRSNRYADGGTTPNDRVASDFDLMSGMSPSDRIAADFAVSPSNFIDPAVYNTLQDYGTTQPGAQDSGLTSGPMADIPVPRPRPTDIPSDIAPVSADAAIASAVPVDSAATPIADTPLSYSGDTPSSPMSATAAPGAGASTPQGFSLLRSLGLGDGLPISSDTRAGLLSAGLGIMAQTSPYGLSNIGAGALKGVQEYDTLQERKQKADLAGKQLAQQLLIHREDLGQRQTQFQNLSAAQKAEVENNKARLQQTQDQQERVFNETVRQHNMANRAPVKLGDDPRTGAPIMAFPRPNPAGNIDYYLIKSDGSISTEPLGAPQASPLSPSQPPAPGPTSALPSSPLNASTQTASLQTGTMTDAAPRPGEGIIPYNQRVAQGAYDYTANAPYIEKGMDVPDPQALAGRSVQALKTDAEYYLETGKLPPVRAGNSPVARVQQNYRNAVQNYAGAMAQSRGMTPEQTSDAWRTAPGMLRFVLGADGRSTVSLGTAVRHLDTLNQLAQAWAANDTQAINRVRAVISREFGGDAATNLQAAGNIVGPEILKAIGVAGAGTADERQTAAKAFGTTASPAQMLGAIQTTQKLLAGQLDGRRRQAAAAGVSEQKFKDLIGDQPYQILTHLDHPQSTQQGSGNAAQRSPQDRAAIDWANNNPNDPRAAKIKQRLGIQ